MNPKLILAVGILVAVLTLVQSQPPPIPVGFQTICADGDMEWVVQMDTWIESLAPQQKQTWKTDFSSEAEQYDRFKD
ncbi:unnamed protein product [Orchesella dallaii]|uniref:Uncharacterized protein n=1 Tax=Orchesella dallaii TaxID=48710 RepID=A0ABP1RQ31_9HEXA